MKTDELKDTIRKSLQDCIDYGMGYVAGRHNLPSIPKEERNRPNIVGEYMQALEVAIAALEKPEYSTLKNKRLQDFLRAKVDEQERHNDFAIATDSVRAWIDIWEDENDLQMTTDRLNPAPVYHYLPEVPEDGEEVIGYSDTYGIEVLKFFKKDNAFMDAQLYETTGVYAWTRIPPKPPVKEGGQNGK